VGLVLLAALPSGAAAKDEYALELCGASGCKVVRDPIVAAALAQATEDFGVAVPAQLESPFFTVRYVPPTGTTYRLAESAIAELQSGSEPRVVDVFDRAVAGIEPFGVRDDGARWWAVAAIVGVGLAVIVVAKRAKRWV
jgi:hypothetical protein